MIALNAGMTLPPIYPILDTTALGNRGCAVEMAAEAMLEGGARILQFRHKGSYSRSTFAIAEKVATLCRGAGALFIIDDRADIAILLDAGLHVGQDDLPPSDARKLIGAERPLGFSTHNCDQLEAAAREPVDYVAVGPIFATASKQNPDPVVGCDELRRIRSRIGKPLVAIGGINRSNMAQVLAAGADSVAIIGDLLPDPCRYQNLRTRMEEWHQLAKT